MPRLVVEIPEDVSEALRLPPAEQERELRKELALALLPARRTVAGHVKPAGRRRAMAIRPASRRAQNPPPLHRRRPPGRHPLCPRPLVIRRRCSSWPRLANFGCFTNSSTRYGFLQPSGVSSLCPFPLCAPLPSGHSRERLSKIVNSANVLDQFSEDYMEEGIAQRGGSMLRVRGHFDGSQIVLDEPLPDDLPPDTPVEIAIPDRRELALRQWRAFSSDWWSRPLAADFQPAGRTWKREDLYERRGGSLS